MNFRDAIGIDPDSHGCSCSMVKVKNEKIIKRKYLATDSGMEMFIKWVKKQGDIIVAIEGSNGLSKPLEKALREERIVFYSFKPSDVAKFRKVVLGENKNNEKDAESVARYAMALESQGRLDRYKRVWFPDEELQGLTRSYEQKSKIMKSEINRLWKLLRAASPDLYLALGGNNPDSDIDNNILQNSGILSLLAAKPDIYEWKCLSDDEFFTAMGGRNYKGCQKHIEELQKLSKTFKPISSAMSLMIKNSVMHILLTKQQSKEIVNMLKEITKDNKDVKALEEFKGVSTITASSLIAEIINIRRFLKNDNLASYSGLGMKENSTGNKESKKEPMVHSSLFNHRLKDAFMNFAKNFVRYNPDSHLSGYFRNLLKDGMPVTEARKRVARSLVRVTFKKLYSIIEDYNSTDLEENIERESDMARGSGLHP